MYQCNDEPSKVKVHDELKSMGEDIIYISHIGDVDILEEKYLYLKLFRQVVNY